MSSDVKKKRSANWDLLRSLAMFLVVVVHSAPYLGEVGGIRVGFMVGKAAMICDPIFFTLSGFFAIRALKNGIGVFYLKKVPAILFPLVVYSLLLYLYTLTAIGFQQASLFSYFNYFYELLKAPWWFIPALIPCLVAAPFLCMTFRRATDKSLAILTGLLCVLFLSGSVLTLLSWFFGTIGISSLEYLCLLLLKLVPPSFLSGGPAYFMFFILGGLIYRLKDQMKKNLQWGFIFIGLTSWTLDVVTAVIDAPRSDPSYWWLFATIGIFLLFNKLDIHSHIVSKVISWVAQRSYAIYLLQATTIYFFMSILYTNGIFGFVPEMGGFARVGINVLLIFLAYLTALGIASIVDPLIVKPLQNLFTNKIVSQLIQREKEDNQEKSMILSWFLGQFKLKE